MANFSDTRRPPLRLLIGEGAMIASRLWRLFGRVGERGPADGPPLMVIPGLKPRANVQLSLWDKQCTSDFRYTL